MSDQIFEVDDSLFLNFFKDIKGTVVDEEGLMAVDHALHEHAHGARVRVLGPGGAARQDGLVEGQNREALLR